MKWRTLYKKFDLSEEKTIYHPGSNFCGKDTFYECFSKILATKINDPLTKCSPGQYLLQLPWIFSHVWYELLIQCCKRFEHVLFAILDNEGNTDPGALPFLPICKKINGSYWAMFWTAWNKASEGPCPKLCTTIKYSAEVIFSSTTKQARILKALL